jgi:starch-binding outer membrane protein, SusD/RagB family
MKKYIFLLIFLTIIVACEKNLLETVPTDRVSQSVFWQTDQDAIFAANAIYRYLDDFMVNYDGLTDILHRNIQFSEEASIERGDYNSLYTLMQTDWTNHYKGIRAANNFLENVDNVESNNPTRIQLLKSEVRFLRAYFYMKLVMLYGDVPLVTQSLTISEGQNVVRNSTSEVWNFINSELDDCANILPSTQTEKGRITKGAALALKARVLLYQGDYNGAAEAANAVISSGIYSLYPKYGELFDYPAENSSEVILDKQFIKDIYSNSAFNLGPYSHKNSGSAYVPTKKIVDSYTMSNGKRINDPDSGFDLDNPYDNRDPRLKFSVFVKGSHLYNGQIYDPTPGSGTNDEIGGTYLATSLGYNIKKYVNEEDFGDPTNCSINIMLIRYAEILLTYAEAKIELNQIDQSVYDAINAIRSRSDVNLPPIESGKTQNQMREIVRHERMLELAFEGHRLFDIRRWRIAEDVIPGYVEGMTYKNSEGNYVTVRIDGFLKVFESKHYLWPIPKKELDLNPGLGQNPGW